MPTDENIARDLSKIIRNIESSGTFLIIGERMQYLERLLRETYNFLKHEFGPQLSQKVSSEFTLNKGGVLLTVRASSISTGPIDFPGMTVRGVYHYGGDCDFPRLIHRMKYLLPKNRKLTTSDISGGTVKFIKKDVVKENYMKLWNDFNASSKEIKTWRQQIIDSLRIPERYLNPVDSQGKEQERKALRCIESLDAPKSLKDLCNYSIRNVPNIDVVMMNTIRDHSEGVQYTRKMVDRLNAIPPCWPMDKPSEDNIYHLELKHIQK